MSPLFSCTPLSLSFTQKQQQSQDISTHINEAEERSRLSIRTTVFLRFLNELRPRFPERLQLDPHPYPRSAQLISMSSTFLPVAASEIFESCSVISTDVQILRLYTFVAGFQLTSHCNISDNRVNSKGNCTSMVVREA